MIMKNLSTDLLTTMKMNEFLLVGRHLIDDNEKFKHEFINNAEIHESFKHKHLLLDVIVIRCKCKLQKL
jgi:hypothetical protein